MKAIVCTKYGSPEVLQYKEVDKPVPKDNEVQVKIHATSVTIGDVYIRTGEHLGSRFYSIMLPIVFGLRKPTPFIDGSYAFKQIPEAHSYVE